jgi:bacteriorhodopsin
MGQTMGGPGCVDSDFAGVTAANAAGKCEAVGITGCDCAAGIADAGKSTQDKCNWLVDNCELPSMKGCMANDWWHPEDLHVADAGKAADYACKTLGITGCDCGKAVADGIKLWDGKKPSGPPSGGLINEAGCAWLHKNCELPMRKLMSGIPNPFGSVDGGHEHGFGTVGGALGLPLMVGFLCMAGTTLFFVAKSRSAGPDAATLYYVSLSVTGIATVAYLCMRANIGIVYVNCAAGWCGSYSEGTRYLAVQSHGGRAFPLFWMRYVDWFFTTPFFLLDLCLLANAHWGETFYVMLMNALSITFGAVGALKPSVNIPFFIGGLFTFFIFIEKLLSIGKNNAHYQGVMKLTMGIWCAYPIMFLVCEMMHVVTTEVEVWMYVVLDVAAKCGCGFLLTEGSRAVKEGH